MAESKDRWLKFWGADWVKDCRLLPLNVRGGWLEIILIAQDSFGVVEGTISDFAKIMSCEISEANLVIQMLKQKKICDYEISPEGIIKITCRKIARQTDISKKRSEAGKKGGNPKLKKNLVDNLLKQKDNQNVEYSNSFSNSNSSLEKGSGKKPLRKLKTEISLEFIPEGNLFREPFIRLVEFRKDIGKPVKLQKSAEALFRELVELSGNAPDTASKIVDRSIANGWQGIFKLENQNHNGTKINSGANRGDSLRDKYPELYRDGKFDHHQLPKNPDYNEPMGGRKRAGLRPDAEHS